MFTVPLLSTWCALYNYMFQRFAVGFSFIHKLTCFDYLVRCLPKQKGLFSTLVNAAVVGLSVIIIFTGNLISLHIVL